MIPCKYILGPYSPTILKHVLSLGLQTFLYLAAFECNTTSDCLNRIGAANQKSCYIQIYKISEKGAKSVLENCLSIPTLEDSDKPQ